VYALIEESVGQPVVSGVALTSAVMAADYTMLPAMKLYDPPWEYDAPALARDFQPPRARPRDRRGMPGAGPALRRFLSAASA